MAEITKGGAKAPPPPSRRQKRYGKLVRGWDWRTDPDLLEKAETTRNALGITRTEFIERAIAELIEKQK